MTLPTCSGRSGRSVLFVAFVSGNRRSTVGGVHFSDGSDYREGVEAAHRRLYQAIARRGPFVLTYRGKRIGVVTPCADDQADGSSEGVDERWAEVEAALVQSEPAFPDWSQATAWIRDRT